MGLDDNVYVNQVATAEFMIHQFKDDAGDYNRVTPLWRGKSTLAPSSSPVYLQIYNQVSTTWITIDSDDTTGADTEFDLTAEVNGLANYKDGVNYISCRVYQLAI